MAKVKKHMILYTELEQWNLVLSTVVIIEAQDHHSGLLLNN